MWPRKVGTTRTLSRPEVYSVGLLGGKTEFRLRGLRPSCTFSPVGEAPPCVHPFLASHLCLSSSYFL